MSMLNKIKENEIVADILNYKHLIAGRPKTGKSSLFYNLIKIKNDGDMSKGLLIAFENGYSALGGIHAIDIEEWEDFQDLADELVEEKDELPYEVLGFDTIDILIDLASAYVVSKASISDRKKYDSIGDVPWGRGYSMLEDEIAKVVGKLDMAGYNLIYITHDKDKTMTTRDGLEYDKTVISASGRGGEYFKNSADIIAFIELTKVLEDGKKVDKRLIHLRGDANYEAGSRFKHVPAKIEYSAENYIKAIEDAILAEYDGDEEKVEEAKEKQAKEEVERQEEMKSEPSPKELISEIDNKLEGASKDEKLELAEWLKEEFGNPNYKKMEDTKDLGKVLDKIEELAS